MLLEDNDLEARMYTIYKRHSKNELLSFLENEILAVQKGHLDQFPISYEPRIEPYWTIGCYSGHNPMDEYRKVSNIRRTSVGNTIVDHSDVVGTSPVGAAPSTSSFST